MSGSYYQDDLAADVLSQFACPGICDGSYSNWHGSIILWATFRCPFGHPQMDAEDHVHQRGGSNLRKIPPYFCVEHFMRMCRRDTQGHNLVNSPPLVKCNAGFHLPVEDLIDLEQLNIRAFSILSNLMNNAAPFTGNSGISQQPSTSQGLRIELEPRGNKQTREVASPENASPVEKPKCAICFEEIVAPSRPFGLLTECTHPFCAPCIINWFQQADSDNACPICRKVSRNISIWPTMVKTSKEKKDIANLQGQATYSTLPNWQ